MFSRKIAAGAAALLVLSQPVAGHMEMSWPFPLHSKFNPQTPEALIDYSMTSPLSADGSNYPCKGYQINRPHQSTATFSAGSTYNMTLAGTATHGGGSCQLSLSYDEGATFRVIQSMIGGCPLTLTYDFTVPANAPTGEALLAWTWQNYEGNREFYMNCAEVNVVSSGYKSRRELGYATMDDRPQIWKANLKTVNNCTTTEGENPVYPNPGNSVVYGDGMSSTSDATPGDCDGSPQRIAADTPSSPIGISTISSLTGASPSPATLDLATTSPSTTAAPRATTSLTTMIVQTDTAFSMSTTTIPSSCADVTVTLAPTTIMTITTIPTRSTSLTRSVTGMSSVATTFVTRISTTSAAISASTSGVPIPPYITGDANAMLPCVPGTFICTSNTTWDTCIQNGVGDGSGQAWIYGSPRNVSDGTMCIPYLSPYSNDNQVYAQQANVPVGYYRDDRIGRARPDGACDQDGSLQCTNGGTSFDICDQGGWVPMGPVASGTTCQDGQIVASP